jgi:hypothetical protein
MVELLQCDSMCDNFLTCVEFTRYLLLVNYCNIHLLEHHKARDK